MTGKVKNVEIDRATPDDGRSKTQSPELLLGDDVLAMEASGISTQDLILLTDFTSLPEIILALC
jgi:hypothetical protein